MKKLDALTGVRFVAAAMVVVNMAGFGGFSEAIDGIPLGSTAVSIFFELSGFVLFFAYDGMTNVRRYAVTRFAENLPLAHHVRDLGSAPCRRLFNPIEGVGAS